MTGPKNILVTGHPGAGKTTLIRKLIQRCGNLALTGFYTEEIRERGERVGFRAVALNGSSAVFAHKQYRADPDRRVGKYGVKPEILESLVLPHLDPGRKRAHLVVIDEIGKMELLSRSFKEVVTKALDSTCPVLASIALRGTGFVKYVKHRVDVEVITLTPQNRDILPDQIYRKIVALHGFEKRGADQIS